MINLFEYSSISDWIYKCQNLSHGTEVYNVEGYD